MKADGTKKQGRMICTDSVLQVCMQVKGREADIALVQCNYTQNKTPRNLLTTKISEMCEILYT